MRLNITILIFIFTFFLSLNAILNESASLKNFVYKTTPNTSYDNWISHVAEGIASEGYNKYANFDKQSNGFGSYVTPSDTTLAEWDNIISEFLEGNLETVESYIDEYNFPYEIVEFLDTDVNRTYYLLREIPDFSFIDDNDTPDDESDDEIGAFTFGWGLYIYNPDASSPTIVTVVHPADDFPAVPTSVEFFQANNATALLISGVGREVSWYDSNNNGYQNGDSTCDPSREEDHVFNVSYQNICDKIRERFGQREFSIQLHTYDWGNSHAGYASIQVSSGYAKKCPDLPIRDHSSLKRDMVNLGNYLIHPANTIGTNPDVYLNDFSTYYYVDYDFQYSSEDTTFAVNNSVDLTGYSQNKQMLYTISGWNMYDSFDPFFHIEMDELPNFYNQNNTSYKWFYGYDFSTNQWDIEHRYDNFLTYYHPWIDNLCASLEYTFEMDDQSIPPTPQNLTVISQTNDGVSLSWSKSDSYDFYSYEIRYSTDPEFNNYETWNRDNYYKLACLSQTSTTISSLFNFEDYYFKIVAIDKNGNVSDESEIVSGMKIPVDYSKFYLRPNENSIYIYWKTNVQNENAEYWSIYRKTEFSEPELIISGEEDTNLICQDNNIQIYAFEDENVEQDIEYFYQLAITDTNGQTHPVSNWEPAIIKPIHRLYLQKDGTFRIDSAEFSTNPYASNQVDNLDITSTPLQDFALFFIYATNNSTTYMKRDTKQSFDSENELKSWTIRFKSDSPNITLFTDLNRNAERLYLKYDNEYYNLNEENVSLEIPTGQWQTATLYYGNYIPNVSFPNATNSIIITGHETEFFWNISHINMISSIDVSLQNEQTTILVGNNLFPTHTNTTLTTSGIYAENLSLVVKLNMLEGDQLSFYSEKKYNIVNNDISINLKKGWNLVSHSFDSSYSNDELYGENAIFMTQFATELSPTETLSSGNAYWIYSPEEYHFDAINTDIILDETAKSLYLGWNLLPNPYQFNLDVNNLTFYYNSYEYDYSEAVQCGIISPKIYDFNNGFHTIETLEPNKSYLIYTGFEGVIANFKKSYSPHIYTDLSDEWRLNLIATNQNDNVSSIQISSNQTATSNYDLLFDCVQPTNLIPFNNFIMNIENDFDLGDEKLFNISDNYNLEESNDFSWNITLYSDVNDTINFKRELFNIPDNYFVYLTIDNNVYSLNNDEGRSYITTSEETNMSLLLTTNFVDTTEESIAPLQFNVQNYPNPFNPSTNIAFEIPSRAKVTISIYNIKGQKVKDLTNDIYQKGKHIITWNGDDNLNKQVSSGVYFYKIAMNKNVITKKMMLLK